MLTMAPIINHNRGGVFPQLSKFETVSAKDWCGTLGYPVRMSEVSGQTGLERGAVSPGVAYAPKPAIGAERFRALTERLRKPQIQAHAPVPVSIQVQPPVVVPVSVSVPEPVPAPEIQSAPTAFEPGPEVLEPSPAEIELAAGPVADEPVAEEPDVVAGPEPGVANEAQEIGSPGLVAPWPEIVTLAPIEILPPPTPTTVFGSSPFARPAANMPLPEPAGDPLQRRLSGLFAPQSSTVTVQLQEILPPPPPPKPPEAIEQLTVDVQPPSMAEVQVRLREDATARLEQLDLENIWRQALSTPTLEERAQYLREAAELMASEGIVVDTSIVLPPEHDLSQIEASVEPDLARDLVLAGKLPLDPELPSLSADQAETAEIARSLLDMMAAGSSSGLPQERALAADTLLRLVPKLALKPLVMLVERLSIMDNPPNLLVGRLIRDPRPEVSGPLLENCMHISDPDLLMVVSEDNPGKRRVLARRRKLSGALSSALIATKDPSVLLTLVRNAAAEISHDGYAALIECAGEVPDIQAPLSTRADLSAPFAFELFWSAPTQLRRYLLSRFLTDSETLTKILRITLATQNEDGANSARLSTGEMIEALGRACKGNIESSAEKIGEALKVSAAVIQRILMDRSGEPIVVMLKVAGFPRGTLGDVLNGLKKGDLPLLDAGREVEELQVMFDTLSSNKARILLTYWDWAVRKAGPYAPVH